MKNDTINWFGFPLSEHGRRGYRDVILTEVNKIMLGICRMHSKKLLLLVKMSRTRSQRFKVREKVRGEFERVFSTQRMVEIWNALGESEVRTGTLTNVSI